MSMSNATESDSLDWILEGTDPAWRAGATGYLALGAGSPDEASPMAGELTYTGYARIAQTKSRRCCITLACFANRASLTFSIGVLRSCFSRWRRAFSRLLIFFMTASSPWASWAR